MTTAWRAIAIWRTLSLNAETQRASSLSRSRALVCSGICAALNIDASWRSPARAGRRFSAPFADRPVSNVALPWKRFHEMRHCDVSA
jgi:hypothetical protein